MLSTARPFLRLFAINLIATSPTVLAESLFTPGDTDCDGVLDVPAPYTTSKVFFRYTIESCDGPDTGDANDADASGSEDTAFLPRSLVIGGSSPAAAWPLVGRNCSPVPDQRQ